MAKATAVLGPDEPLLAAGIFALQDGYLALAAGATIGSEVTSLAGGGALLGGVGAAAGMHVARDARAASQGLTERMLVAVSAEHIHILDWVTGSGPTRVLRTYVRASTDITMKRFGLSRHVTLHDRASDHSLKLSGTTARISAEAGGDKAVLAVLAG